MPIKSLTNRAPSFPRLGELRKGGERPSSGKRPGEDLNEFFRFTSKMSDVVQAFESVYSNRPEHINIILPYTTTDENFETWVEEWSAGGLKWRGDGEKLVLQQVNGKYKSWSLNDPSAPDQPNGGKEVGRLKVIIPELKRLGYVVTLTHSLNDILEIDANLRAIEALRGSLQGIPFVLSRVPREISTPSGNGNRARRTKYLLHIEPDPQWVEMQIGHMQTAALGSADGAMQLGSGDVIEHVDFETGEIVEDYEPPVEDSEPTQKKNGNALKAFHATGKTLYGDEWDSKRADLCAHFDVGSSSKLTDEQLLTLTKGMKEKLNEKSENDLHMEDMIENAASVY